MAKNSKNRTSRKPKSISPGPKRRPSGKKGHKIQLRINFKIIAIVFLIIGVWIAWPYLSDKSSAERGAAVPKGTYCYGIDISHYQDDIQWDSLMVLTDGARRTTRSKLAAKDIKPISFVFIKATEGSTMKDKSFKKHWTAASDHSISRGAYHFFRSSKDAENQARHFINTVGELSDNDLPPVLDIETIHKGCSYKTLNDKALMWLKTVEKHYGRKPIVYSSASFIEKNLYKEITDNYPIWVAHYGAERPRCDKWHIWQFADNAKVYGIDGEVDLNVTTEQMLRKL